MIHAEGPLLSIDVGMEETTETDIDDTLESFVGGRGVGTKLAHDRIPFDADPFGPENRVVFAAGPLQTSQTSYTGRMSATALSPLTDGLLSSNAGGFVSRPFVATGYSAVEITGAGDELVGLHVTDEGVEFEAVPDLEGAIVDDVLDYLDDEHDIGMEHTMVMGPAGENLVRYACIMTSESRAFGRGGLGAVLGSKGVKFLTFDVRESQSDSRSPSEARSASEDGDSTSDIGLDEALAAEIHREAATSGSPMKDAGTVSVSDYANAVGALPTKYFEELQYDEVSEIGSSAVIEHKYKKGTCSQCAFACKLPTRDDETGLETEGPEYETMMSFGSNQLVDDFGALLKSNELCDQHGLDTISCGDAIAAYLQAEDEFGNTELVHELVEQISRREGVGDTLAEGIDRFHGELDVENWTMKGMEFAAHDGRTLNGQGLSFATSNRGADHMYAEMYQLEYPLVAPDQALDSDGVAGKAERLIEQENKNAVHDSGVLCKFSYSNMTHDRYARLFDTDWETLMDVGGRIVDLERHFNNQRGFDRSDDDALPYEIEGLTEELSNYYELRGWSDEGVAPDPTAGSGAAPADD